MLCKNYQEGRENQLRVNYSIQPALIESHNGNIHEKDIVIPILFKILRSVSFKG
jgi:hypothetical protein